MRSVELEVPVEIEGFAADVDIQYSVGQYDPAKAMEQMNGYVKMNKSRVYLEGNFDVQELLALVFMLEDDLDV